MDAKNGTTNGEAVTPLTPVQKTQPFALTWAAVILMILGLGYKEFSKQEPDIADAVVKDHKEEITQIVGIVIVLAGSMLHKRNDEKSESAVKTANDQAAIASLAPPMKEDGSSCPYHTMSIGLQQLISRKNPGDVEAAEAILSALKKVECEDHG